MESTRRPPGRRSVPAGLLAWANERFPLSNAAMFLVLYATGMSFGRMLTTSGPIRLSPREILGFLAAWSFFLMLRVFDEHKDYELDCHNHPDRVLQSGWITLGHLKMLGVVAICVQIGVSWIYDQGFGRVTSLWCIVMAWSSLMAVEFFCGEWLQERLLLYATSHMLVMPMALIWMAQMGAADRPLPPDIAVLAGLSFLSGASFEVARKLKAPEDERDTVDSYTKVFGTTTAPLVVMGLLIAGTATLLWLLHIVFPEGPAPHWYVVVAVPLLPALWALQRFRSVPSGNASKTAEGLVGLSMLASNVVVLAALYTQRGATWVTGW